MQISRVLTSKFFIGFLLLSFLCHARAGTQELPEPLMNLLNSSSINPDHLGLVVQSVTSTSPILSINPNKKFSPASVFKIVTAYSALLVLGSNYSWETTINGRMDDHGNLIGDLVVEAGGDPMLTLGDWQELWRNLYLMGIHHISGNIIIEEQRYGIDYIDPNRFDHQGDRVYNLIPHPLTIDFDHLTFLITPVNDHVVVSMDFPWQNYKIINHIHLTQEKCPEDPEQFVHLDTQQKNIETVVTISGEWASSCGIGHITRRYVNHEELVKQSIKEIWNELGGQLDGKILFNSQHNEMPKLVSHRSKPLFELISLMNKYSNNVMARMIYLNMGNSQSMGLTSYTKTEKKINEKMQEIGIETKDVVFDNGSGLSRKTKLTPQFLNNLLLKIWQDPLGIEVISSFPLMGSDGTLRKQDNTLGVNKMYLKTGTLKEVKAIAGFIQAKSGQWLSVVCIINDENAGSGSKFMSSLLNWIYLTQ